MSQVNPNAPMQKQPGLSKWWPIGFFIAAIIMFIIGGGLFGAYSSSASSCVDNFYNNYYGSYGSLYGSGCTGNTGEFYGGLACLAIGGILKLIGWILLIVFCVKRRRALHAQAVTHYYAPPTGQYQQPYAPQAYSPQQPYPQPYIPQPAGYPSAYPARSPAASPAPGPNSYAQPPYQAPDASATPPPNGPKEAMTSTHYT